MPQPGIGRDASLAGGLAAGEGVVWRILCPLESLSRNGFRPAASRPMPKLPLRVFRLRPFELCLLPLATRIAVASVQTVDYRSHGLKQRVIVRLQ